MQLETNWAESILSAAEHIFRARGYHATSLNDVAEACHIQKASLYHHFSSKEQLAIAVMWKVQNYFDNSILCYAYDKGFSSQSRLSKVNSELRQFFVVQAGCCLFTSFAIEQMESMPSFMEPIRHYFCSLKDAYTAIFTGKYGIETSISLANDFVSDLQGALIMLRVTKDEKPLDRLFSRVSQVLQADLHDELAVVQPKTERLSGYEKTKARAKL